MALPSFFKRKDARAAARRAGPTAGDEGGALQAARAQARRRLIGAVVLLAIGVTVFPMLFETQPRPLQADIPIELPQRDPALARPTPPVRAAQDAPAAPPAVESAQAPDSSASAAGTVPEPPAAARPRPKVPVAAAETPSAPAPGSDGERARALLEGRAVAAAAGASAGKSRRYVVQVGAYTDPNTLRDVRARVEKLGLKTYTQSIDTDAGKRTRVRVGPYDSRPEAEEASGKLKGAGLPGNVLVL